MFTDIMIVVSAAAYWAGATYDTIMTETGLEKGIAVERNTFLVGSHPSWRALFKRDMLMSIPMVVAGILVHPALYIAPAFAGGLIHLRGGLKWRTLMNGGTLNPQDSVWRKFLGF